MAYDEWFETAYKENLELLERVACSFMLKKLGCGMAVYARYADQAEEEIQEAFALLWAKRERLSPLSQYCRLADQHGEKQADAYHLAAGRPFWCSACLPAASPAPFG